MSERLEKARREAIDDACSCDSMNGYSCHAHVSLRELEAAVWEEAMERAEQVVLDSIDHICFTEAVCGRDDCKLVHSITTILRSLAKEPLK